MLTTGLDLGSNSIKFALLQDGEVTRLYSEKIRRRNPKLVAEEGYKRLLGQAGVSPSELSYIATTGEAELVEFRTGHFYSMTTHARGGLYLHPEALAVVDIGSLHIRVMQINNQGRVLNHKMTSQCASGSGQFLENISRYLGVCRDEIGAISLTSKKPEPCNSICAVLAETDAINMVSRGIATADIVKGIHISLADRLIKLLRACKAQGKVMLTGGLSQDIGLLAALQEEMQREIMKQGEAPYSFVTHQDAAYAGAIGAAIWGAFRFEKSYHKISSQV